jgi:hypothetical protein
MKSDLSNGTKEVNKFLADLDHPLKPEIIEIRKIILSSHAQLTEHIKWKAPSFCFNGDDRVTMKLFPPKNIQLIFHRGAKVKVQPAKPLISDDKGLLKWLANDRAVMTFETMDEIKTRANDLTGTIGKWIAAAEK